MMTPEEKYRLLYEGMYELCSQQGWGDPFSYARSREIYMAGLLGHTISESYSGEDAKDQDGGAEYKSTIGKNISGTYNGISVQENWEEQERYLKEDKIGKYPNHYFQFFFQRLKSNLKKIKTPPRKIRVLGQPFQKKRFILTELGLSDDIRNLV
jgi:hypothetical protein